MRKNAGKQATRATAIAPFARCDSVTSSAARRRKSTRFFLFFIFSPLILFRSLGARTFRFAPLSRYFAAVLRIMTARNYYSDISDAYIPLFGFYRVNLKLGSLTLNVHTLAIKK